MLSRGPADKGTDATERPPSWASIRMTRSPAKGAPPDTITLGAECGLMSGGGGPKHHSLAVCKLSAWGGRIPRQFALGGATGDPA